MRLWKHEGPCVYRLYTNDNGLLYIGSTGDLDRRMRLHLSSSRLPDADVIRWNWRLDDCDGYPTLPEARAAEREAIANERPLLNRNHNPSRWKRINEHDFEPVGDTAALIAALPYPLKETA